MTDPDLLLSRIDSLARETDPVRAEGQLNDILVPLMTLDGYSVERTGGTRDSGLDFLGTSAGTSRIGVQFKHTKRPVAPNIVREVIGTSIRHGLDRMLLISTSGFTAAARAELERQLPTTLELVDLDFLRAWSTRPRQPNDPERSAAVAAITELSAELARIIARTPHELDHIEWRDLERLVHAVFSRLGFTATLTPSAKDGGRDVILNFSVERAKRTFLVEVKHWRSGQRVGSSHLTDFVKVVAAESANGGLFLSSYGYAGNALEAVVQIDKHPLHIGNENKIVSLCRTFVRAEGGLFQAPHDLTEIITADTILPGAAQLTVAADGASRRS